MLNYNDNYAYIQYYVRTSIINRPKVLLLYRPRTVLRY